MLLLPGGHSVRMEEWELPYRVKIQWRFGGVDLVWLHPPRPPSTSPLGNRLCVCGRPDYRVWPPRGCWGGGPVFMCTI